MTDKFVYVIDDEANCRSSISRLVSSFGYQVADFGSAEEFLNYERSSSSECAIVDNRLMGMSGVDLQRALSVRGDSLPVIFLTGYAETELVVQAMRQGALTFLEKPVRAEPLRQAIEEALATDVSRKEAFARSANVSEESLKKARLIHELSPREREVANFVATGYSNKKIAAELGLSEKTIEKYRSNCVRKLRAKSSAEMVRSVVVAELMGI